MTDEQTPKAGPIGVGAVSVVPGESDGILADLPQDDRFELVAFSDEGLGTRWPRERPVRFCRDYNVLLKDPAVELVLVDGPVEKRRDSAVRALNAGRHVVVAPPFCESAPDAERVMKTALRAGLVATMDLPWRREPDLLALQAALAAENAGEVHGLQLCCSCEDAGGGSLVERDGLALLDRVNVLLTSEVKSVTAHVRRAAGAETGLTLYLALRGGGWAMAQAVAGARPERPRWTLYRGRSVFMADGGRAAVRTGDEQTTYDSPSEPVCFWENVRAAVRDGADLLHHPAQIVRAMKLHEAALESAELGEPVIL